MNLYDAIILLIGLAAVIGFSVGTYRDAKKSMSDLLHHKPKGNSQSKVSKPQQHRKVTHS